MVSIETVGASGAFYVASASDKIYADKGSIVGSIGVIAQWVNYGDLLKWAKLKDVVIKTGEFKDTGNPARDLTPAEQAYMQSLIDNMFGQFIKAVADGRGMKYDDVKAIANGKVWTGEQAQVDEADRQVGDFETAVADTAKSVGHLGRTDAGASGEGPPNADGSAAGRRFAVDSQPRENDGAAGGLLLPVEVVRTAQHLMADRSSAELDARGLTCGFRRLQTCIQPLKFEKVMGAARSQPRDRTEDSARR